MQQTATPLRASLLDGPGLTHGFFTRQGGVSTGVYASLNGGVGSRDDPHAVAENRRRMTVTLGIEPAHLLVPYPVSYTHLADLTAHVDFCALARAARAAGAAVHGPVPQGEWLARLGINERAAALRRHAGERQSAAIDSALLRLAGNGAVPIGATMARLFKVLAVASPSLGALPGFETAAA